MRPVCRIALGTALLLTACDRPVTQPTAVAPGPRFQTVASVPITQITTDPEIQADPAFSGNHIVWEDHRHGRSEIYVFDLATNTETRITTNTAEQVDPAVSGNRIVWRDLRIGNYDVFLYDLGTGTERQITGLLAFQLSPAVSGDRIVWQDERNGNWDIYLFDLSTNTETRITTDPGDQVAPSISGDRIVWQDLRNGTFNGDVFLYDLATGLETRITTDAAVAVTPVISGDRIVWQDLRDGHFDIYLFDLSTGAETRITTDPGDQEKPGISGDTIVWQDDRNGNWDIYLYELGTGIETRVTSNPSSQLEPAISGNRIVWEDHRNGLADIYGLFPPVVNQPPTADAGGPYTGVEGTALTLALGGSDPDGDALSFTWDLGDGTTGSGATPPTSHTYADNGSYTITVTADDGTATHTATATATVANAAPTITGISAPLDPVAVNTAVTLRASFTDPGVNDDPWSYSIDWGDGSSPSTGSVSAQGANALGATQTYAAAGVYPVGVSVTDKDGGSDAEIFQYVVVYDPSAGFVTGGGWIDSPTGAYAEDPTLAGKASFGFVSKYKRGATMPDGNTQFQFRAAGLEFHSTAYDWLVIAGARAQFKGTGQINGAGDYGFLLTAIDGKVNGGGGVDRFRLKIWDVATGNVVYDNQMGNADDADPTTALGGGSIVIHR